jgi:muramidase (phage lysozyme)
MNRGLAVIVLGFGIGAVLWAWSRETEAAPLAAEPDLDPAWDPVFEEWPGGAEDPPVEELQQVEEEGGIGLVDKVLYGVIPVSYDMENANLQAFLAMIRYAEGTSGANGYRTLFGGGLFDSFDDHPRQYIVASLGGREITSSAAGAYQFLARTWDDVRGILSLPDFSPASQDRAAAFLIRRRGALADVNAGRFDVAISKCNKEWASLAGSPYGQPTKSLSNLRRVYVASGGQVAGGTVIA